ncbi:uncharacterized protein SCHCODRAFT_02045989 [Schizophyllum commune H4-8]|uniref:uncharacterized protein n=1 Tax=Schizophyllum commune (strain H4-8 / FGSC 9210) TaxID=578458 RepID=UPI00215DFB56|nr:uncharacterized protein SCHCODRAFT_02045989 [Schizophyllum commune H4-8]KAI5888119.1 hypothetical protein SCHCODRAFT_02045989 [Schizophyllum commune H4-8]
MRGRLRSGVDAESPSLWSRCGGRLLSSQSVGAKSTLHSSQSVRSRLLSGRCAFDSLAGDDADSTPSQAMAETPSLSVDAKPPPSQADAGSPHRCQSVGAKQPRSQSTRSRLLRSQSVRGRLLSRAIRSLSSQVGVKSTPSQSVGAKRPC